MKEANPLMSYAAELESAITKVALVCDQDDDSSMDATVLSYCKSSFHTTSCCSGFVATLRGVAHYLEASPTDYSFSPHCEQYRSLMRTMALQRGQCPSFGFFFVSSMMFAVTIPVGTAMMV